MCLWGGGKGRSSLWSRSVAHYRQLFRGREMCHTASWVDKSYSGWLWAETEAEKAQAINIWQATEAKQWWWRLPLPYFSVYFLSISSCQLWKRQEECKPAEIPGSSWKVCPSRHILPCVKLLQELCLPGCNSSWTTSVPCPALTCTCRASFANLRLPNLDFHQCSLGERLWRAFPLYPQQRLPSTFCVPLTAWYSLGLRCFITCLLGKQQQQWNHKLGQNKPHKMKKTRRPRSWIHSYLS